ncbi:unnamed protein product [Linum tenue]|uniref:Uncharacterized protein n=1 Tax=Linum tenue TaxID=586396 RepID=A0AAV0NPL7_9ROSI|nr:unnamed protein product [Linum tenue]
MASIADRKPKVPLGSRRRSSGRSYVATRWVYKLRGQWKKSSNSSSQFSYDIRSYTLNFDDGGCLDQALRSHVSSR